jgi:transcription antitermination factor NusB
MAQKEARRQSRMLALRAFFSYLQRDRTVSLNKSYQHVLWNVDKRLGDVFAQKLVESANLNYAKMKVVLKVFAPDFPFEKIAPINRALLLLGLTEMKYLGTPPVVVINEYVELSKIYGEDKSAGFINAVLDGYRKSLGLTNQKQKDDQVFGDEHLEGNQ